MSRDFNRIDVILNEIEIYWKERPDLRLAQIVSNIAKEHGYDDVFYFEDNDLLNTLKEKNSKKGY